jgi:hypothetical protein
MALMKMCKRFLQYNFVHVHYLKNKLIRISIIQNMAKLHSKNTLVNNLENARNAVLELQKCNKFSGGWKL